MGAISRGIKNAFRNTIRTVSITFILGLSIAMALIMLLALKTVQSKITTVKSSIGNTIAVSPAGVRGFEGGGEQLTMQNAEDIAALPHVTKITESVMDHLTSTQTNLVSAIEAGSFGNRQRQRQSEENLTNSNTNNPAPTGNMSMPIMISGSNDFSEANSLGTTSYSITAGEKIDGNSTENIAIIGTDLATKNSLTVGSTFKAYSQDVKVVGIFDSGNKFTNSTAYMPIRALQNISGQSDEINSIVVKTDSVDSLASVQTAIKSKLGEDKVDVVSSEETAKNAIAPLENIKTISLYSLIGSLVAGAVIIFLTMIMIVRERRREIGVLKAIGSSNIKIVSQFTVESLVLTLMSSVLGMILGIVFSNPVLKVLVNNSQSSNSGAPEQIGKVAGGMMARMGGGIGNVQNTLSNIHAVINYEIIFYGLLAAIIIAIIGSAIPAFFIAKIRPAEVMRAE